MAPSSFQFSSMGTHWEVQIWDDISPQQFAELKKTSQQMAEDFDQYFSRFKTDSFVSKISNKTGRIDVSEDFISMLTLYKQFYEPSGKKLNPLIGNTISDLGYDATYSLKKQENIRHTPDLDSVQILSTHTIDIAEPVLFDFGAVGKGFFVDTLFLFLQSNGLEHLLVNGSGDVRYNGPPIRLGLEDPQDGTKAIGVLTMSNGAFAASGTNRRAWNNEHHIIDPENNTSTKGILASWVQAPSAALADLLATTLILSDAAPLKDVTPFAYCIMNDERKIMRSKNFTAELFMK